MGCHDVRPLLPARVEELTPLEARVRADHVAGCPRCAAEAAAYSRLVQALAAMAALEAEPVAGTLERSLAVLDRRRLVVSDPRVAMVAAGSAGALVATLVVVARALRQRRKMPRAAGQVSGLAPLAAPALGRLK